MRAAHHWEPGQKLMAIDAGDGLLLKSETHFQETALEEVASCLKYHGKAKSLDDMAEAIRQGSGGSTRDSDWH